MDKTLSNEQVSTYLAQLGHEMRSPLHSILGFTHMLSESCEDPNHLEWLNHIRSSGQHLLELINDIIDLELLNHHKVSITNEAIDVFELVKLVQQGFQPQAIIGQLQLDSHIDKDCPRVWRGDNRKLKQVLINLISNAIKFTPPQGQITVSLSQVNSGLRISVQDTGIGINTDALSQLFTPFYHNISAVNQQGMGIGLAITRRLIELMKGEILVNSQPDDGCEFIIILPLVVSDETALTAKLEDQLPKLLKTTSVLLVDDDQLHHEVFHGMVQKLPFMVYSALTAEEAINLYEQKQPPLILIDYRLPDSDGLTLAKKLRRLINHHDRQQQTRVVMLTAQSNEHFESALLDGTLDAWLSKPLQLRELILLANVCELNNQQQRIASNSSKPIPNQNKAEIILAIDMLPSYLRNLWPEFVSEINNGIRYCQQLLNANKMTELMTKAHQLKGQSMVFQQRPLIHLLEQLEHHAQNRDTDACQHILTQAARIHSI
jgi:CheY-like chemotaxis protein